jgi:hypothetical protein
LTNIYRDWGEPMAYSDDPVRDDLFRIETKIDWILAYLGERDFRPTPTRGIGRCKRFQILSRRTKENRHQDIL